MTSIKHLAQDKTRSLLILGITTIYIPITSALQSITLSGSLTNPGDTATANIDTGGLVSTGSTATYAGYHLDTDGHYTYFFSGSGGGLASTVAFAVSGGTMPTLAATNLTAGPAPADPAITPCFVTGTQIRTTRGDVAVEDLMVGDKVLTMGGGVQPGTWIGRRKDEAARYAPQHLVDFWPVKFLSLRGLKLHAPAAGQLRHADDPGAVGQRAIDGRFDDGRRQEGEVYGHADVALATAFTDSKRFRVVHTPTGQFI